MKKTILLLAICATLISMSGCKKDATVIFDNADFYPGLANSETITVKTCRNGTIVFPTNGHSYYNAMSMSFTLNPNNIISFSPIDSSGCH